MPAQRPYWQRPRHGYDPSSSPAYGPNGSRHQIHEPFDIQAAQLLRIRVRLTPHGPVLPVSILFAYSWRGSSEALYLSERRYSPPRIPQFTLFAWVLGLILIFGGIFSTTKPRDITASFETLPLPEQTLPYCSVPCPRSAPANRMHEMRNPL